jgi:hypothetical protein
MASCSAFCRLFSSPSYWPPSHFGLKHIWSMGKIRMNPIAKEYYSTVSKGRWNTE